MARYIDIDDREVIWCGDNGEYGKYNIPLEMIERSTADVVEVKHGHWVVDNEYIDCSVCKHEKWSKIPYEDLVRRFKYCPNCGADMRGGTIEQ